MRHQRLHHHALLAASLLCVSCSGHEAALNTDQATVTDSAGIAIVQNHRPIWGEGEGWKVSAEPVLVIADTMATGAGRGVMRVARLQNGDVVLTTDVEGRWFDSTGALLRTFAPQGEGPGEFSYISSLLVLPGDTVVAGALGWRWKLAFYAPDGRLVREQGIDMERLRSLGRWGECQDYLLPDLSQVLCQHDPTLPASETNRGNRVSAEGMSSPGPGLLRQLRRLYLVPVALDTAYRLGIDIGIEQQMVSIGGQETSIRHPFHAKSSLAAGGSPLRIAIATNPRWEIGVWTGQGVLSHIIRLDGGRRAASDAERARADAFVRDPSGWYIRDEPGLRRDQLLAALEVPDSLPGHGGPGHGGVHIAPGGEIISPRFRHWHADELSQFDVFNAEGRWLGMFELPAKFRLVEVGTDYLLGVRFDEDDVPSVVVYGLQR